MATHHLDALNTIVCSSSDLSRLAYWCLPTPFAGPQPTPSSCALSAPGMFCALV